jgi:hypothetical protein
MDEEANNRFGYKLPDQFRHKQQMVIVHPNKVSWAVDVDDALREG